MKNNQILARSLGLLMACGTVATLSRSALANVVDERMSFSATVLPICALSSGSASSNIPMDYSQNNNSSGLTDRKSSLTATDSISFDCNTDTVEVTISTEVTFPIAVFAENLGSVEHIVDINFSTGLSDRYLTSSGFKTLMNEITPTDENGDLTINLRSTISAQGEELLAGDYKANFTINVATP